MSFFSFSFWLFIILKERTMHNSLNVEINESSTVWVALGLWPSVPGWRMNKLVWAEVIGTLTLVQLSSPNYRSWQFVKWLRELSQMRWERSTFNKTKCPIMPWSCQHFEESPWCIWALYLPNSNMSELTTVNNTKERVH